MRAVPSPALTYLHHDEPQHGRCLPAPVTHVLLRLIVRRMEQGLLVIEHRAEIRMSVLLRQALMQRFFFRTFGWRAVSCLVKAVQL